VSDPSTVRRRTNAFTVDVEEWFHVCGADDRLPAASWDALPSRVVETTRWVLDELDAAGVRATFFVLGWVAERYPSIVRDIQAGGHQIGSHGFSHRRAYELGPRGFAADLQRSVEAIAAAGVRDVQAFRAPEWSINDRSMWALDELVRQGFAVDASMAPVRLVGNVKYPRHPHVRPTSSGTIAEFPPFVVQRFGQAIPMGWGWGFRMSSPSQVLKRIDDANRAGSAAVFMVHPWELDPDPPRMSLPLRLRFAHYFRLSGFRSRLAAVLRGGDFGALQDLAVCP